jgi:hypothetical protein
MLPSEQAMALLAIVVATAPKSVLKIGTFMGHTTKLLARNLPEAIIHSVDLPLDFIPEQDKVAGAKKDDFHLIAKRQVGREYRGTLYETRIRQHFVDTAVWNFKKPPEPHCFSLMALTPMTTVKMTRNAAMNYAEGKVFSCGMIATIHIPELLKHFMSGVRLVDLWFESKEHRLHTGMVI